MPRMRPTIVIAANLLASTALLAAPAVVALRDVQFLEGLRGRGLFELAEKYCLDELAKSDVNDARRADLTIELSRTFAQHAAESQDDVAASLWQKARQVVDDFARQHPRHPKLLLIRAQGALASLAQGEMARETAELSNGQPRGFDAARDLLRGAIGRLRKLDEDLAAEIKRRNSTSAAKAGDAQLSMSELISLEMNLRHQWARSLENQARCYPPGSADRVNSLSQAVELLEELARLDLEAPLAWSSRLDEIVCLQLLEDFATAERKLAALEKANPPPDVLSKLQAQRIHLPLARGRLDEALSEAARGASRAGTDGAEVQYARLEAYVKAWQRAIERPDAAAASKWEKTAVDQVDSIERAGGATWMRKAEALWAGSLAAAPGTTSARALATAAAGYYRGGRLDQALAAYDRSAQQAHDERDAAQAFAASLAAAAIERERQHDRSAIDRYRKLALAWPENPHAGEAHLLAVHGAAQLAARQKPPKLDEYERLLREHVATWPAGATASQAWWWLGRLKEHQHAYQEAIAAFRGVRPDDAQYVGAVEAIGRCYLALCEAARRGGKPGTAAADEALAYFEQVIAPGGKDPAKWSEAARAAVLAVARISLAEVPGGAAKAEERLHSALSGAPDAPRAWKNAALAVLVPMLAARGRIAQAEDLLKQMPIDASADALAMALALADVRTRANGEAKRKLAALEIVAIDDLLLRRDEVDAPTVQRILRQRAEALADSGRRTEAIEALESLAKDNPRDGQTQELLASRLMAGGDAASLQAALVKWREVAAKSRPASPRWFRAHYGLARTQLELGERTQARLTIKRVESVGGDFGGGQLKARFQRLVAESQRGAEASGAKPE